MKFLRGVAPGVAASFERLDVPRFDRNSRNCPNCGLKYEVDSGAWLGTLTIAYGVGAAVAVALTPH
jgi:hypothetical protein